MLNKYEHYKFFELIKAVENKRNESIDNRKQPNKSFWLYMSKLFDPLDTNSMIDFYPTELLADILDLGDEDNLWIIDVLNSFIEVMKENNIPEGSKFFIGR